MTDDMVRRAVRTLRGDVQIRGDELAGSQSGSGVHLVRTDERDAVLKVTAAGNGQPAARRELTFYRTLASRVPVQTPELLDHIDNDEFTVLLLTAHAAPRRATEWDLADWLELARQLAALHSTPLPDDPCFAHRSWLREVLDQPPIRTAEDYWSRTEAATVLDRLLESIAEFGSAMDVLPARFVHGDCHVDNLLRDGERIIWTDWQGTGIGCPAGDLAFVGSRANADGADVPYDAMLHEYATASGTESEPLRRAVAAVELGTLLFGWPNYVEHHTQDQRDRLTRRLLSLAAYWNAAR